VTNARTSRSKTALQDEQAAEQAAEQVTDAAAALKSGETSRKQTLDNAQTQVTNARTSLDSVKADNAVKTEGAKPADVAIAENGVESARMSVDSARKTLSKAVLRAPIAGTVASVAGDVGDTVSGGGGASSSSSGASASSSAGSSSSGSSSGSSSSSSSGGFVTLTKLTGLQLTVAFTESDATKLRVGQAATVTVSALPERELAAHVIEIAPTGTTDSGAVSFDVTFALDRTVPELKPGMTADVEVVVQQAKDALLVPSGAVRTAGGSSSVTVVGSKGEQTRVPVTIGVKGDTTTQVLSGLKAGESIVLTSVTTSTSSSATSGRSGTTGTLGGGSGLGGGGFGGGGFGGGFGGGGRAFGGGVR
jgi:multidrug efflux pump subunit AcrA (membrane-fusion protein)